jgi:acyl dehydratase
VSAATVLDGVAALRAAVGRHLGHSDWLTIDAERVRGFAQATGAAVEGEHVPPDLLVALSNFFLPQIVEVRDISMGMNYGTGAIRFPAPVPIGARVRASAELVSCEDVPGGVQTTMRIVVERDDAGAEPGCVIESLSRWVE